MPSFSWWSGNAFIMMTIVAYGEKKSCFFFLHFLYSILENLMLLNFCCCLYQSWHIVVGHWISFKTIFILLTSDALKFEPNSVVHYYCLVRYLMHQMFCVVCQKSYSQEFICLTLPWIENSVAYLKNARKIKIDDICYCNFTSYQT